MANMTPRRIKELERAEAKLQALEAGGVHHWEWYGGALKEYWAKIESEDAQEDAQDDFIEELFDTLSGYDSTDIEEPAGRGAGYSITFTTNAKSEVEALLAKWGGTFKTPRGAK